MKNKIFKITYKDEWENTKITITRNGIDSTLEFDKSDIVKTEEIEE